jgi:RNA polymerase sigma-70 factor (ECF subfamily)
MQPLKVVEGINGKDPTAQLWVQDAFFFRLLNTVKKFTHGSPESEDILMGVFICLWETSDTFKSVRGIYRFLYRIAERESLKHKKDREIEKRHSENLNTHFLNLEEKSRKNAEINDRFNYIMSKAIEVLPRRQKQVFLMAYRDLKSNEQIAKQLGSSIRTIETQKSHAYRTLKIEARKDGMFYMFMLSFVL